MRPTPYDVVIGLGGVRKQNAARHSQFAMLRSSRRNPWCDIPIKRNRGAKKQDGYRQQALVRTADEQVLEMVS